METNHVINMTGETIKMFDDSEGRLVIIPPHKNTSGLPIVIDAVNYRSTSADTVRTEFGDIKIGFGWPTQKFQVCEVNRFRKTVINVVCDNMDFYECRRWLAHEVDIARKKTGNEDVKLTVIVDPRVFLSGFNNTELNHPPNTTIAIAVGRKTITRKDWLGQEVREEVFTHLAYPSVVI